MPDLGAGAERAQKARSGHHVPLGTVHPLAERVWHWLHAMFPERQVYIRSHGEVQFFTFSPSLQVTLAGLALIFLGWVSFASVNVIFKDHILAAKDRRYEAMQTRYETRVADLQLSYDELNGALVAAGDRFKSTADELQAKQESLASLVGTKEALDAKLATLRNAASSALLPKRAGGGSFDSLGLRLRPSPSSDESEVLVLPQPAPAQPRTARPTRASLADVGSNLWQAVKSLFVPHRQQMKDKLAKHPALLELSEQTARLEKLSAETGKLVVLADQALDLRVRNAEQVMRMAGLDAPAMMKKRAARSDMGGPLLPLSQMPLDGVRDEAFKQDYLEARATLSRLEGLLTAMVHVPLSGPVNGPGFELTSDFGVRSDPFSGHAAFHAGLDFGGPMGARVFATAPGIVVWAGPKGPYGNMVEVDHGMGLRTRYGHLSRVTVRRGAQVAKGMAVGRVGSTGRSTGPHVHYEVWLDNRVRDPAKFLEAGRHVLE